MDERCVNKNIENKCQIKGKIGMKCESSDLCLDFEPDTEYRQIFKDDKWF